MKTILYIHGFASAGSSGTAVNLRNSLYEKDVRVLSPDVPVSPKVALPFLKNFVQENNIDLIVATSMGGLFAEQLRGVTRILVNPSFHMAKSLTFRGLGKYQEFFNKRADNAKKFMLDKALVQEFKEIESLSFKDVTDGDKALVYGLFGKNDNVVNCQDEFKKVYGSNNFQIFDGEHRLNEEVLKKVVMPLIMKLLNI